MAKIKTKKTRPIFKMGALVGLLFFLSLTVWAVQQKTSLSGKASVLSSTTDQIQRESFEAGFGGWEKGAWMPDQKAWSLNRVQEKKAVYPRPYNGKWEIAAYQDGTGDDGTVWLTKAFRVQPNFQYKVKLSFYLWSPVQTPINEWSVVAYEGLVKPEIKSSPDQWRFFETIGLTGEVAGWKQYSYGKTIKAGAKDSIIWLAFGQHVLWETPRTYFWDLVQVEIKNISPTPTPTPTPKPKTTPTPTPTLRSTPTPAPTPVATFSGIIQKPAASICQQGTHSLLISAKENLIFLQSKTYNLDKYLGKQVEVSGKTTPLVECKGVLVDVASLNLKLN